MQIYTSSSKSRIPGFPRAEGRSYIDPLGGPRGRAEKERVARWLIRLWTGGTMQFS